MDEEFSFATEGDCQNVVVVVVSDDRVLVSY